MAGRFASFRGGNSERIGSSIWLDHLCLGHHRGSRAGSTPVPVTSYRKSARTLEQHRAAVVSKMTLCETLLYPGARHLKFVRLNSYATRYGPPSPNFIQDGGSSRRIRTDRKSTRLNSSHLGI